MTPPIGAINATIAGAGAPTMAAPTKDAPSPKVLQAARDFESIFVRQMLKSLEKTTAAGCGTHASAGEKTYGSMIVDTISESISKAGGLGLADVIAKSLMAEHPSIVAAATSKEAIMAPSPVGITPLKSLK